MTRLTLVLALAIVALALTTAAVAATSTYSGPRLWSANESAGSSFGNWFYNFFSKNSSGYDTTVTFIDNVSYSWHRTIRNTSGTTYTWWSGPQARKGHCYAHSGYFHGSCWVAT